VVPEFISREEFYSPKYTGTTTSLYCKKPGLKGGSKRQMRVSSDRAMFSFAAAARSSRVFLSDSSVVALPLNDMAIQVSVSSSRSLILGSLGSGKCPKVLPDGITNETNHSLDCSGVR